MRRDHSSLVIACYQWLLHASRRVTQRIANASRTSERSVPSIPPVRVPDHLVSRMTEAAKRRGITLAAWQRDAFRAYLDDEARGEQMDRLEARLVATLNRVGRDTRLARNDTQMAIAMLDTFVRLFLLHTPPIPREAVRASAAAADERHEKYVRNFIATLQGDTGLIERLAAVFEGHDQDEAADE